MKIQKTPTMTVIPAHGSPGRPTKYNTDIFFQEKYGHESQLGARNQEGLTD
jgi:hypothetical protein